MTCFFIILIIIVNKPQMLSSLALTVRSRDYDVKL